MPGAEPPQHRRPRPLAEQPQHWQHFRGCPKVPGPGTSASPSIIPCRCTGLHAPSPLLVAAPCPVPVPAGNGRDCARLSLWHGHWHTFELIPKAPVERQLWIDPKMPFKMRGSAVVNR
jgi:hypothetical protein